MVVDLHSLTVRNDPEKLREMTLNSYALLLACGVDPKKSRIFIQSHVKAHSELAWILSCYTQFGEISRMTQFKEKSTANSKNINAGLFTYPIMQAADILLYNADLVPVGADQKQHIELARDIAVRMNGMYGDLFTVPQPYIKKFSSKIMSLAEPSKKMSKSDPNINGYISLLDSPKDILKKFKKATTDSEAIVRYQEGKEGINNLMTIYKAMTKKSYETIELEFASKGYGDFKVAVAQSVVEYLEPIQKRYHELIKDKAYLQTEYKSAAESSNEIAQKTLSRVHKKLGLINL